MEDSNDLNNRLKIMICATHSFPALSDCHFSVFFVILDILCCFSIILAHSFLIHINHDH